MAAKGRSAAKRPAGQSEVEVAREWLDGELTEQAEIAHTRIAELQDELGRWGRVKYACDRALDALRTEVKQRPDEDELPF